VSFFSEERAAELKELFFESAQELLQTLNEEGLKLERRPDDPEIVRSVRRTVHTLKGDSAACGYKELSELAHNLEDALTPELAKAAHKRLAELVLAAADTFEAMLNAYRGGKEAPSAIALQNQIKQLVQKPSTVPAASAQKPLSVNFVWSEYEQMVIADAAARGEKVYNVALSIDANCTMPEAAVEMARKALPQLGRLLAMHPQEGLPLAGLTVIEAALASNFKPEVIEKKCIVPAVIDRALVQRCASLPGYSEEKSRSVTAHLPDPVVMSPTGNAQVRGVELPQQPAAEAEPQSEAQPQASASAASAAENTLRVDSARIDDVLNLVGELILGKSMLQQTMLEFDKRFTKDPLRTKFGDALAFQARVLNDLQKSVMKIRMVPVEHLFRRFPRIVRDVSKARGKEVGLAVSGQETDLDKSILDVLAEPMAHLVRNAVDHGIELPADRVAAGKPSQGTLRLNAYHQGNQVVIEVSDDGHGIDVKKVVARAIERRVISHEEANRLSETEALQLIFHPGLSTAEAVTEISGRGVGMDVVKTVIDRLKGTIEIRSKLGQGTTFLLKVPLTMAIIKALLFHVGEKIYAVPLSSVQEIARAKESEIHRVDQHEVLKLREEVLTLVRVGKLNRKTTPAGRKKLFIVVINVSDRKFGLIVDRMVGEEELVIKALDDQLVATDLVSGASILGDGTVVLILNISAVVTRLGRVASELRAGNLNAKGASV
jgi:two-component system, chemotaxis family, sensor kinase CheA